MNINDVKELIKVIDKTNINELKLEIDNMKLELCKNGSLKNKGVINTDVVYESNDEDVADVYDQDTSSYEVQSNVNEDNLHIICAPIVGTFYSAQTPNDPDFVKVGDRVSSDSTLCILEAMKLMNEIKAEIDGEIVEVLAKNETLVEYNQPLFKIRLV